LGTGTVFEAKHTSAFAKSDEVLERYMPQLQHNMAVTGYQQASPSSSAIINSRSSRSLPTGFTGSSFSTPKYSIDLTRLAREFVMRSPFRLKLAE
jgi:hypothetical protein